MNMSNILSFRHMESDESSFVWWLNYNTYIIVKDSVEDF